MITYYDGESLDLQKMLNNISNKLNLSTTGINGEMHVKYINPFGKSETENFMGPGTNLFYQSNDKPGRLNDDRSIKTWSIQTNLPDYWSYEHDLAYYDAGDDLNKKHEADQIFIDKLKNFEPKNLKEKFLKFVAENALKMKLKFGMSLMMDDLFGEGISKEESKELHTQGRKYYPREMIKHTGLNHTFSIDLIDMTKSKDENYNYIFTCIDNFSKFAWGIPIKNKTGKEIITCLKEIFKDRKPIKITSDLGKEFVNKEVKDYLNDEKVEWYSTNSEKKASIVERLIKTLKLEIWKKFTENENEKWVDLIKDIVDKYNNTPHSSLKFLTPIEGSEKRIEGLIRHIFYLKTLKHKEKNNKKPKFQLNDKVRLYNYKNAFHKGYKENFTREIFTISKINDTFPVTYQITDEKGNEIKGKVYTEELLKTKFDHT